MQKIIGVSWIVLTICISFTFVIWGGYFYSLSQSENQSFENDADFMTLSIKDELNHYEQVLIGAQGVFAASNNVELSGWRSFVDTQEIEIKFPGLQGVGYVQHTLHEDREKLITEMKSYGSNAFDIKPAGDRDEYYPVLFLEPLDLRNQQAIGYDIFFEQTRKNTVNALIETGDTTITGKIILVQEIDENIQNGFLMLVPIYSNSDPDSLKGIVYTVFRIDDFVKGSVDLELFEYLRLKIYDDDVSEENLFFNSNTISHHEFGEPTFTKSFSTSINNRNWVFVYEGIASPINLIDILITLAIPVIGFSMSTLLFYLFRIVAKNLKLSQSAIKAEKTSIMGTMASRLSHDLRNPLTVIKSNLDLMMRNLEPDEKTMKFSKRIDDSVDSMTNIIEDVLQFSKTPILQKEPSSINELLESAISNIDVPDKIKITLPKSDFLINCDQSKIKSVFSNLITNSIQSIEGEGKITISINEESNYLNIYFEDSGSGIVEDDITKIFEPLFTTKVTGTGLGLGICKNIIDEHGGMISVHNNPTTFTIKLPKKT